MSLEELKKRIFECKKCALHVAGRGVPGEGPPAKLMIVGEAPGAEEQAIGRPFVGRAGRLLRELLKDEGVNVFYITNVVKHRPPNNRRPTEEEVLACKEYLEEEIAAVKPKVILALGSTAIGFFTGDKRVGGTRVVKKGEVYYVLTYHPAAVLRNPKLRDELVNAIKAAKEALGRP